MSNLSAQSFMKSYLDTRRIAKAFPDPNDFTVSFGRLQGSVKLDLGHGYALTWSLTGLEDGVYMLAGDVTKNGKNTFSVGHSYRIDTKVPGMDFLSRSCFDNAVVAAKRAVNDNIHTDDGTYSGYLRVRHKVDEVVGQAFSSYERALEANRAKKVVEALLDPDEFLSDFSNSVITLKDTDPPSHMVIFCYNGKPIRQIGVSTHFREKYEQFYNWANRRWPLSRAGSVSNWIGELSTVNAYDKWKAQQRPYTESEIDPDRFITGFMQNTFRLSSASGRGHAGNTLVWYGGKEVDEVTITASGRQDFQDMLNWCNRQMPFDPKKKMFYQWLQDITDAGLRSKWRSMKMRTMEAEINPDMFLTTFVRRRFTVKFHQVTAYDGEVLGIGNVSYGHTHLTNLNVKDAAEAKEHEEYFNWLNSGPSPFPVRKLCANHIRNDNIFRDWSQEAGKLGLYDDFQKRKWEGRKNARA